MGAASQRCFFSDAQSSDQSDESSPGEEEEGEGEEGEAYDARAIEVAPRAGAGDGARRAATRDAAARGRDAGEDEGGVRARTTTTREADPRTGERRRSAGRAWAAGGHPRAAMHEGGIVEEPARGRAGEGGG